MRERLDSAARPVVMPRAWLFDLDGTLISNVERFHAAYCSALDARGRSSVDEPTFVARYRSGELVTSLGLHADDADGFWRDLMEVFLARSDLGTLLPGAAEALSDLAARGSRIALVTGRAASEDALRTELTGAASEISVAQGWTSPLAAPLAVVGHRRISRASGAR